MAPVSVDMRLPMTLTGKADLQRLRRELESLGDYLHQAALRKTAASDIRLPKLSRLLDDFAKLNKLNLLHRADYEKANQFLDEVINKAPQLHVSFSVEPSSAFLAKLTAWLRQNIHPLVLVQVGLQPAIAAGCIIRTANKQFDLSLTGSFTKHRADLIAQLKGTGA